MSREPAVTAFLKIRERFWYNSEKSFNNKSASDKEKTTRSEETKNDWN